MVSLKTQVMQQDAWVQAARNTRTILIPVANPDTAATLMEIARRMTDPGGRIVVLYVMTQGDDIDHRRVETFRGLVESAQTIAEHIGITLITQRATNPIDGILKVTSQIKADMILLGLSYSVRGQVELGPIAEAVAEQAGCDVVVYRRGHKSQISRIVVPVGGSIASRTILEIGIRLGDGYQLPIDALHVYSDSSEWDAHTHVENLLRNLPGSDRVNVNLVRGIRTSESILSRTDEADLLVIGFSERSPLEKWLFGDTAQRLLDRAQGPVLMVARAIDDAELQALSRRRLSWLRPLLTDTEQEQILWEAKDNALPSTDYAALLLVAALLASLGLLMNSSAVIIGAMLVAPLMQPIIALGVGLCTARLNLMRKAFVTILLSLAAVIGVGFLSGVIIGPSGKTTEMLARAYPSLLDAGVALGAGFIGAYATARKDIPAALAGVAIAAALVPPVCTVGLSLAIGEPRLAMGAGLLFAANMVCITIIGAAVFYWMGMRPTRLETDMRRRRYASLLASTLFVLMVIAGMLNYSQHPGVERISETRLQTVFAPAEVVNLTITHQDPLFLVATIRSAEDVSPETVKMAEVMLSEDLGTPARLRVVVQKVIEGAEWAAP